MKVSDKIYTDNRGVYAELPIFSQADANVEYIRKDAFVERINKQILFYKNSVPVNDYEDGCNKGAIAALEYIVKSL